MRQFLCRGPRGTNQEMMVAWAPSHTCREATGLGVQGPAFPQTAFPMARVPGIGTFPGVEQDPRPSTSSSGRFYAFEISILGPGTEFR